MLVDFLCKIERIYSWDLFVGLRNTMAKVSYQKELVEHTCLSIGLVGHACVNNLLWI
jgi:hypothetical protein